MISTTKAEICTHPAAVFPTHWPRSSGVEETSGRCSPQSRAAILAWLGLTAKSFPELLQHGDRALLAAHVLRCAPCTAVMAGTGGWHGAGCASLDSALSGGISSCTFLNGLYVFCWLSCAGAEHLVCLAWWLPMVLGPEKPRERSLTSGCWIWPKKNEMEGKPGDLLPG